MTESEHARLIGIMEEVFAHQQWDRLGEVYAPDAVMEYPQSGERFRGLQNIRAQFENYPDLDAGSTELSDVIGGEGYALTPAYTVIRVEGSGQRGTAILRVQYGDGSHWWVINIHDFRDGRISRAVTYFAPDFEAAEWRAPFREAP